MTDFFTETAGLGLRGKGPEFRIGLQVFFFFLGGGGGFPNLRRVLCLWGMVVVRFRTVDKPCYLSRLQIRGLAASKCRFKLIGFRNWSLP